MNTNGHDMPDLVFVEFTNNDITYSTQTKQNLRLQIESLFRNIYAINPNVEIIAAITARTDAGCPSRSVYIDVAEKYGIPVIDMGGLLNNKMVERGYADESSGNYYYTVDNLHPSTFGYEVYFEKVKEELTEHLLNAKAANILYNYNNNLPLDVKSKFISTPTKMTLNNSSVTYSGNASIINTGAIYQMFGVVSDVNAPETNPTTYNLTENSLEITGEATVVAKFKGNVLGVMFNMPSNKNVNVTYSIDGGEDKTIVIDNSNYYWVRGYNPVVWMLEHGLDSAEHTVTFKFSGDTNTLLSAILTN